MLNSTLPNPRVTLVELFVLIIIPMSSVVAESWWGPATSNEYDPLSIGKVWQYDGYRTDTLGSKVKGSERVIFVSVEDTVVLNHRTSWLLRTISQRNESRSDTNFAYVYFSENGDEMNFDGKTFDVPVGIGEWGIGKWIVQNALSLFNSKGECVTNDTSEYSDDHYRTSEKQIVTTRYEARNVSHYAGDTTMTVLGKSLLAVHLIKESRIVKVSNPGFPTMDTVVEARISHGFYSKGIGGVKFMGEGSVAYSPKAPGNVKKTGGYVWELVSVR